MKINRFIALAAIALLVVGAMGAISMKAFAQTDAQTQTCNEQDDSMEVQDAPDTDTDNVECGDQTDGQDEADSADEQEGADGAESAPTGTPAISAEAAQKTAESYLNAGTATKVELDDENGKLIYQVEIGGTDVNVDAMTGDVLGAEPAEE